MTMRRLSDLALSDSGFVFDPHSGSTFTVNATGALVLHALKDGLGLDAIVDRVCAAFDGRGADLRRDVEDFTHELRRLGLVADADG